MYGQYNFKQFNFKLIHYLQVHLFLASTYQLNHHINHAIQPIHKDQSKESLFTHQKKTFKHNFYSFSQQILSQGFLFILTPIMNAWFCTTCSAQNQKDSEIVLFSNQSDITYDASKTFHNPKQISLQSGFIMLRKSLYHQYLENCIKNKQKFTDQEFPPTLKSISQTGLDQFPQLKNKTIVWKRISQIYGNCELIKGKIQPSDIQQGNIGDCYFLAAISALAQNENTILQIFQKKHAKQMIKSELGIYKLVINVAGQPSEIIIDDHIPVYSMSQRPVFCKPVNNEFWVVLLQKAWAKINKSYRNIAFGNPHEVLNRFSVAPVFYHSIPTQNSIDRSNNKSRERLQIEQNLWSKIMQGHKQNFPMCCGSREGVMDDGIKPSHSYALLAAYEVEFKDKMIRLVKLRNPWGNTEYIGRYSENDQFWNSVDPKIKQSIFDTKEDDGLFIMPYDVFMTNFQNIDISHSKPDYNYVFKPIILNGQKASFYKINVQKEGEVYITFERNLQKNSGKDKYQSSGVSKILVAQEYENKRFEYVDSSIQISLADVTVRCKNLKIGDYIVMISNEDTQNSNQLSFLGNNMRKGTLSTYSNSICSIEQIGDIKTFVFDYFYTHAVKYNKQKTKIGVHSQSWIAKKLIESSGYGYICISSDSKDTKCFSIVINTKHIQDNGFLLEFQPNVMDSVKSHHQGRIEIEIRPGQVMIFLFRINFKKQHLVFNFPPPGFDVKRII